MRRSGTSSKQLLLLAWSILALVCVRLPVSSAFAQECSILRASINYDSLAWKSTDGGIGWTTLVDVNTDFLAHQLSRIVVDPSNPSNIFLATNNGVFKSTNAGCSWKDSSIGLSERSTRDLIIDPKTPANLYAITGKRSSSPYLAPPSNKLFITTDDGNNWQAVSFDLDITCLTLDPERTSTLYLGASGQNLVGIYKSTDNGKSFSFLKQFDNTGGISIKYIVVDPTASSTIYYGANRSSGADTIGALYKSTDGGVTFSAIKHPFELRFTSALVIDSRDSSILYEATSRDLLRSTDGGSNWASLSYRGFPIFAESLSRDYVNTLYSSVDLPVGSLIPVHNLLKSTDQGQTWNSVTYKSSASSLAFDPGNASIIYDVGYIAPVQVFSVSITANKVVVTAFNVHEGATLVVDGVTFKTVLRPEGANSGYRDLISRKAARNIIPGQVVSITVVEADGTEVPGFGFRPG